MPKVECDSAGRLGYIPLQMFVVCEEKTCDCQNLKTCNSEFSTTRSIHWCRDNTSIPIWDQAIFGVILIMTVVVLLAANTAIPAPQNGMRPPQRVSKCVECGARRHQ
jgi:hypothetical protein